MNKFIEDGLKARHERREGLLQIYRDINNFFIQRRTKKIIAKNKKKLATTLSQTTTRKLEDSYIEQLLTGDTMNSSAMFDWDRKDVAGKENGGSKYIAVMESFLYKNNIYLPEIALLQKNKELIENIFIQEEPQRVIDVGGGDGQKTIALLDTLNPNIVGACNFTTKDISVSLGNLYKKNIEQWASKKYRSIKSFFMPESFLDKNELLSNKDKRIFLSLGLGIGNAEDEDIIGTLANMIPEKVLGRRSILTTVGIAPDENSKKYEDDVNKLLATYGSPDTTNPYYNKETHTATEDRIMSSIYYHLGDKVRNKIQFDVTYENQGEKGGRVLLGAKVLEGFSYTVGNITYEKKQGDMIYGIQSRKLNPSYFVKLGQKAGCDLQSVKIQDGIGLFHMKSPGINIDNITAGRIASLKKKAMLFGAGALIVGGMYLGNIAQAYKERKTREIERIKGADEQLGIKNGKSGLGPTATGIRNSRDIYKEYFTKIYGVKNIDDLQVDFLSWYLQEYLRGNIRYGGQHGGYNEPIEIVERYITQERLRIKSDKKIDFITHPELQSKEEEMRNTLNANDSLFSVEYAPGSFRSDQSEKLYYGDNFIKKFSTYKTKEDYFNYDYIFEEKDGKTYMLAKKSNSDDDFTIKDAKTIIKDYFTPILARDISNHFASLVNQDGVYLNNRDIRDKMIQMHIDGFEFDYSIFKNDIYNIHSKYFLQTFFPEMCLKDSTINGDLQETINDIYKEIKKYESGWYPNKQEYNSFMSKTFHTILSTELLPGFVKQEKGVRTKDTVSLKEWIKDNIKNLKEGGFNEFPFQADYLSDDVISKRGSIIKYKDNLIESSGIIEAATTEQLFEKKGIYTTKTGQKFERGYINSGDNKLLVANYIRDDKEEFIKKQCLPQIEDQYLDGYHYGRKEADKKILQQGRTITNMEVYDNIVIAKEKYKGYTSLILRVPNTYFGNIVYQDRLHK